MPITSSAKKALRASFKKAEWNIARKEAVKSVTKKLKKLVGEKKIADAEKLLKDAYKAIDKAAKMDTLKKGTASRKKSRLAAFIKKAKQAVQ